MTDNPEPEPQAGGPVATVNSLTVPCTALDLYNWVKGLHAQRSGGHRGSQITATGTAINAS
jgi:hypothetical protein